MTSDTTAAEALDKLTETRQRLVEENSQISDRAGGSD